MKNTYSPALESLPEFCTPAEVAPVLSISKATAYRMANAGILPCLHLGRRVIVSKTHLIAWIERSICGGID